ncbi:hypothetical protein NL676_028865 [Syzygium grande]|nr:hypothetical protein NL676_028865 [Syzygium grande]
MYYHPACHVFGCRHLHQICGHHYLLPGFPTKGVPPGMMVPLLPRPPYGPPPGAPPMMRPPLPPSPPPALLEDELAAIRPPIPPKPSYVKSAAPTVVKRSLAQHTPELIAMPTVTTTVAAPGPATPIVVKPEVVSSSSAAPKSIDDLYYMAFLRT